MDEEERAQRRARIAQGFTLAVAAFAALAATVLAATDRALRDPDVHGERVATS